LKPETQLVPANETDRLQQSLAKAKESLNDLSARGQRRYAREAEDRAEIIIRLSNVQIAEERCIAEYQLARLRNMRAVHQASSQLEIEKLEAQIKLLEGQARTIGAEVQLEAAKDHAQFMRFVSKCPPEVQMQLLDQREKKLLVQSRVARLQQQIFSGSVTAQSAESTPPSDAPEMESDISEETIQKMATKAFYALSKYEDSEEETQWEEWEKSVKHHFPALPAEQIISRARELRELAR
jgi:Mn-dependent DtxR family transcriptional regulator